MTNLKLFFAAQEAAAARGQLRLRAVLDCRDGLPYLDQSEYTLTLYVGGIRTWSCIRKLEGKSNRAWVAEEMMGEALVNVLLTGFRDTAARALRLQEDFNSVELLSKAPLANELLPQ